MPYRNVIEWPDPDAQIKPYEWQNGLQHPFLQGWLIVRAPGVLCGAVQRRDLGLVEADEVNFSVGQVPPEVSRQILAAH